MRSTSFPPWPYFAEDEIEAVNRVLRSGRVNYWTGEEGRLFEQEFAAHVGCKYAVALANGTVALELALYALGIGPGDEVIVPSRTFIATASCVVMRGAKPILADVDTHSQNLTPATILPLLSQRTKAIIAVHLAGWPCEMDPILDLAREYNLRVIEDCAQSIGALYKTQSVGGLGDVAAFSFCQDKIMTTLGEGGMLTTNDPRLWKLAWSFKDHGKSYEAVSRKSDSAGFRWLHESFGTNWRLTEVQSAVGRVLLRKIPAMVAIRRQYADLLTREFRRFTALSVPTPPEHIFHAYYKLYAFIRPEKLKPGWTRDRILAAINAEGIPCFSGICSEIYLEKAFTPDMRPASRYEVAKHLGETSLMFMIHPTLSEADIRQTSEAVAKVLEIATDTAALSPRTGLLEPIESCRR